MTTETKTIDGVTMVLSAYLTNRVACAVVAQLDKKITQRDLDNAQRFFAARWLAA
jgi:putative aminopeptidase FrvX